jgi:uncharacterized protein (TIGR00369 family)
MKELLALFGGCGLNKTRRLNPDHVANVAETVNSCPYFGLLSMQMKDLTWGQSRLEARIGEKHLQPYGMVHGGVCASLIDAAAFWAVYTKIQSDHGLTTVEMKLNYLAPSADGVLAASGRCLKIGRTLCLGEASIADARGRLLAHGTATFMIVESLEISGQSQLPPKYLQD